MLWGFAFKTEHEGDPSTFTTATQLFSIPVKLVSPSALFVGQVTKIVTRHFSDGTIGRGRVGDKC